MTDEENTVTRGGDNIFADLGFENPEDELLKANIVIRISAILSDRKLTQVAAGRIMGLSQPDVSKLLRGRIEGFSLERLLGLVVSLGSDVEIRIGKPQIAERGHLMLEEVQ